jgi:Tat protein translocase TatB subunit
MFNVSGMELLIILLLALIVLGPDKLPDTARKVGRAMAEVRRITGGFQAEIRDAMREPVDGFMKPVSTNTPKGIDTMAAADIAEGAESGGGDVTVDPPAEPMVAEGQEPRERRADGDTAA